ncbi:MAG: hypothetical protein MR522_02885 [Trueperella sp.]|uniref:hypothetical protein n=1 Tax=Trueperella sp. TaxID=2699835 RepID=UPI0025D0ACAE|nr:hypothetical protein [Trueperella sp.]MCI7305201.1 hypothetical protein [Trueperella sp.]MDY5403834.1 hypothetical protein [Trueperella sp.]
MGKYEEILEDITSGYYPQLSHGAVFAIQGDFEQQDDYFAIDGFLQFTLLESIDVPDKLLDDIEAEVRAGWDSELTERTLGWIAKHRQRNQAA